MTLIMKLERILIKLYTQNVSLLFNQTCNYIHTHTHIYMLQSQCGFRLDLGSMDGHDFSAYQLIEKCIEHWVAFYQGFKNSHKRTGLFSRPFYESLAINQISSTCLNSYMKAWVNFNGLLLVQITNNGGKQGDILNPTCMVTYFLSQKLTKVRQVQYTGHYWRSRDKLISNFSHGLLHIDTLVLADQLRLTFISSAWKLDDLPRVMARERVKGIHVIRNSSLQIKQTLTCMQICMQLCFPWSMLSFWLYHLLEKA